MGPLVSLFLLLVTGMHHCWVRLLILLAVLGHAYDPAAAQRDAVDGEDDPVKFWTEADSVDARWNETELDRFLASVIELPDGPVRKGLSIQVGDAKQATVCYDTEHLALRGAWSGGFLKFDPARYGIINSPAIDGELLFSAPEASGWQAEELEYLGMYVHGERVVLRYRVDGIEVLESPWADPLRITRSFEIAPHEKPLVLNTSATATPQITIPPSSQPQKVQVTYIARTLPSGVERVETSEDVASNLRALTRGGPTRWPKTVIVRGEPATDESQPYVIDKITLPMENPYRALMFVGGHGFFSGDNGRGTGDSGPETGDRGEETRPDMAICTMHGEVWTVEGVDQNLDRLEWRRFATGLFQPLGMVVVDNVPHVLGRDQITRLHDLNGDGEADYYENFCNAYFTSAGRHDFITSLERDESGNLYFAHATKGVMRVSPDGKECESLANGLRNPNGLGASPDGFVTVAPQQGNWTPSSCIFHVERGNYYGFPGPKETPDRPLGFDPPLCWIPHSQDNSSGSQAWVTSDRWGPLSGQMLHFSYGQCTMMLTLREELDGQWQGGNIDFPLLFDSGAMRGRFSPTDGQLYVSGLRGWQNRAAHDGCLARVRYTGRPVDMPVGVQTMQNGVAVTFTRPLDPEAAEDATNYGVQRWNYRYSESYGSPDLSVDNPGEEGRDDVAVRSATLQGDGRTVFLEIPDLRPADQYLVQYAIRAHDGAEIEQEFSYTIYAIGAERLDESRLRRGMRAEGLPPEVAARLMPGVILRFAQGTGAAEGGQAGSLSHAPRDVRRGRLAALYVAEGDPPTPRLQPGAFSATADAYLHIRQPGNYRFALSGSGRATVRIGGREAEAIILTADPTEWMVVRLGNGYHPLVIQYDSPAQEDASLRLWWASDDFRPEPVPPDLLHHIADDEELVEAERHYRGRELFAAHNCAACHRSGAVGARTEETPLALPAPDLAGAGTRLNKTWLAAWIENPHALRSQARMPGLTASLRGAEREQAAADLAAFVGRFESRSLEPQDNAFPDGARERNRATDRGELLYERLACLACHRLDPPALADEHDRVSLHFVSTKYLPGALADYLQAPHKHNAAARMPDFQLSRDEAIALEAYLRREATAQLTDEASRRGDPVRGRALFASVGCANCHVRDDIEAAIASAVAFDGSADLVRGCLAGDDGRRGGAPMFHFTSEDRDALRDFLQSSDRSLEVTTPLETAVRLVRDLRCTACHDRDGLAAPRGRLALDEGITGLAPEPIPSLTWTGEKLRSEWIEAFLAGRAESPRPWLEARMPHYPDRWAAPLANGLAAEHGLPPAADLPAPAGKPDVDLAEIGRRLTLQNALDCRQCHGVGDIAPRGDERTLNAPGINFVDVAPRVRREFFFRLLHDPLRVDPGTKMPKLAEDGKTKVASYFDGDADRQFQAIWQHIQAVGKTPVPKSE